jgi:hypothetical protein
LADFNVGDVVARLRVDSSQFTQAINDAIARLGQFRQATAGLSQQQTQSGHAVQQQTQAMHGLAQAVQQTTQATTQATSAWRNMLQVAGGIGLATGIGAIVGQLRDFAVETVQVGARMEQLRASLGALAGSMSAGQQQFDQLFQSAQRLGVPFESLARGWRTLTAAATQAGLPLSDQQRLLEAVATEGRRVGASNEELTRAFLALGQMAAKGCHAPGTLIRMADGSAKPVEAIAVGEAVMGPDHCPRWVQVLAQGEESLYRVHPLMGQPFVVNAHHLLRVWDSEAHEDRTLLLLDYLAEAAAPRRRYRLLHESFPPVPFTVEDANAGAFYGFLLSGDHLYLDAQGFQHHNTVSMEELRQQLAEALPTALAAMAQGMGRTTEELIKLVEAGGVRFPTAARALTQGLLDLQRAGGTTADTLQTAFNRFGNEVIRARDELTRMGGPLKTATDIATGFLKTLNDSAQAQRQLREAQAGEGRIGTGLREGDTNRLSPEQQRRLTQLNRLLGEQALQQSDPNAPPMFQPSREEYIQQLKAERDAIYANAQAIKAKRDEDLASTAVENKRRSDERIRTDTVSDLTKQMDALAKAEATYRREAAQFPALKGREGGTLEEQATFQKGRADAVRAELDKLAKSMADLPKGVTLPPELIERANEINAKYGGILKNIEAIEDRQDAARKAARAAEHEAKQAVTDALELDASLERLWGFIRKPTESPSEEARTRVLVEGAQRQKQLEQDIVKLERSKSLQEKRPEALEQFRALREEIQKAVAAQGELAADEVLKRQIAPLADMARGYGAVTKEVSDLAKAQDLVLKLIGSDAEEQAFAYLSVIEQVAKVEARLPDLRREAAASAKVFAESQVGTRFTTGLETQLEQLQASPYDRTGTKLRAQARRQGVELDAQHEALIKQIEAQERWNGLMEMAGRIGDSAAQTITTGLLSIIDGTQRVGEAFKQMAKSILDSLAQILVSEGLKALFRLGIGAISGGLGAGTGQVGFGAGSGFDAGLRNIQPLATYPAQGGAIINKPTHILAGENPAMNPEYVVNHPQMQALMQAAVRAGPSAGGQASGGGVTIINYTSNNKAQAEQEASTQRAQGRQAILNEVLADLSKGEGSSISRMLRVGGR